MKNELTFKNSTVESMQRCDNYVLIKFKNKGRNDFFDNYFYILTDGNDVIEIESCDNIYASFEMNGEKYVVLTIFGHRKIICFPSKEIIFEDTEGSPYKDIYKVDDNVLEIYDAKKRLFNVKLKKYIDPKENYYYHDVLKPGYYVFEEENNDKKFYERKRYICDEFGKILFDDLIGYVAMEDDKIILSKENSLEILSFDDENIVTVSKNENIIAKPQIYENKIICVFKDGVRIYNLDMEEIKYIPLDLGKINDLTFNADTLYLSVPDDYVYKHIFVNLINGNIIKHAHIDGYPYFTPKTFIGVDDRDEEKIREHFIYNEFCEFKRKIKTKIIENVDVEEDIFLAFGPYRKDKQYLYNSKKDILKEVNYDYISFKNNDGYGYAYNYETDTFDFMDLDFNILYKDFDFKKYGISNRDVNNRKVGLNFINSYLIIMHSFTDGYGIHRKRKVIIDANGNIVYDTYDKRVSIVGKYIQIKEKYEVAIYIDTTTGEMRTMSVKLPFKDNELYIEAMDIESVPKIETKVKKVVK